MLILTCDRKGMSLKLLGEKKAAVVKLWPLLLETAFHFNEALKFNEALLLAQDLITPLILINLHFVWCILDLVMSYSASDIIDIYYCARI